MTTAALRLVLAITLPLAFAACTSGTAGESGDDSSDTKPATEKESARPSKKAASASKNPKASSKGSTTNTDDDAEATPEATQEIASGEACDGDDECASGKCADHVCAFTLGEICPGPDAPCTGKTTSERVACAHFGTFAGATYQCMKAGDYQGTGQCSACFSEIDCPTVPAGTVHACKDNTCVSAKGSAAFRCY